MCRSFDVSFITGLFSYAIAYYLYRRNIKYDRAFALVLVTFSTIQWLEAFLWYNGNLANPVTNRLATSFIPIVLALEFMASYYAASLFFPTSKIETVIYLVAFFGLVISWYSKSRVTTIDPNTGSLLWGDIAVEPLGRFVFLALAIYPLLKFARVSFTAILIVLTIVGTFIYSFKFGDTFGSNWCWMANIIAFLQLFSPMIDAPL